MGQLRFSLLAFMVVGSLLGGALGSHAQTRAPRSGEETRATYKVPPAPTALPAQAITAPVSRGEQRSRSEITISVPNSLGPPCEGDEAGAELMCVESLSIRFAGYPDLSGTYRINPDGTISIPGIGRVPVRGLDAISLEKLLSRKLTDVGGRESFASVEVATYLPILIVGHVNTSGQRPWHPGMTVQQAVAMSGGISTQLKNAIADQQRVLTTLARLRAELQDQADIQTPQQLVDLVGKAAADELIKAQRPLFLNRRRSIENQLDTPERGRVLASQELEGLKAQNEKIAEQLRLRREYRSKVQALESKGLMRADMSMESDLRISELEEKSTNIIVAVARVQGTLAGLQREAMLLKQTTQAAIYEEITRLQTESDRLAVTIDAARITHGAAQAANSSEVEPNEAFTIGYKIVRLEASSRRTVEANESTLLKPGDTLVVWQGHE